MKKKYRARHNFYGEMIVPVEVERETRVSVWIDGIRHNKHSIYSSYHDSFDEAKKYLLTIANRKVEQSRHRLERNQQILANVEGFKE